MKNVSFIRASAGSGKTYQLSSHLIGLLLREPAEDPASLLATTFTRAAAGEILARVMTRLSQAVLSEADRHQLSKDLGVTLTAPRCEEALQRLADHLHRLNIGTIDSFFAKVARSLPDLVELPRNWRVISEESDLALSAEVLVKLAAGPGAEKLKKAWKAWRSPGLKIPNREALLEVLMVIRFRVLGSLPPQPHPEFVSAQEAAEWGDIIADLPGQLNKADKKGYRAPSKNFEKARNKLLNGIQAGAVFEVIVRESRILQDLITGNDNDLPPGWVEALGDLTTSARNAVVAGYIRRQNALCDLRTLYDPARKEASLSSGGVTFAEIEEAVSEALMMEEGGAAEDLAFHLDARITHLLIDEFQDTSRKQFEFFRPVINEIVSQPDRTAYVVGDPKQAIYGWRGSDPEVIGGFEKSIPESSLEVKSLSTSYRSSPAILETVDRIFQGLAAVDPDLLGGGVFEEASRQWMTGYASHSAHHKTLSGSARLWCLPKDVEETEFLIRRVKELLAQSDPPDEIAILLRRSKRIPAVIDSLRQNGIDAAPGGSGTMLTDSLAVEMILAGLIALDHPSPRSAAALLASQASWGGKLKEPTGSDLLRVWQRVWENEGAAGLLGSWILDPDFQAALSSHDQTRCRQVLAMARQFDGAGGGRASALASAIRAARISAGRPAPVRVMTIHASKGLEYDAVILGDLGTCGKGPNAAPDFVREELSGEEHWVESNEALALVVDQASKKTRHAIRTVSEELSLLYVGMTRARQSLDLIVTKRGPTSKSFTKSSLLELVLAPDAEASESKPAWQEDHPGLPKRESASAVLPEDPDFSPSESLLPTKISRSPLLDRRSPSSQEGGETVTIAKRFGGGGARGMAVGTAIHAWLAGVEWRDDLPKIHPGKLLADTSSEWVGMEPAMAKSLLAELMEKLSGSHQALARAFDRKAYASAWEVPEAGVQVWRERAFVVPMDKVLWNGRFDRVVIARNSDGEITHAEIIDFKSDVVTTPEILAEKTRFYQPQLDSYAEILTHALRKQTRKPVISTSLVFTGWSG
ncbi:MAG: UvrD-helicase domain-containing protein [Terrimicrobiaceae bacterium]